MKEFRLPMINVNETNKDDNQPRTSSQTRNSPRLPSVTVETTFRTNV